MDLIPWSHAPGGGVPTLRGWRSPPSGKPVLHFLHGNGLCGRTYDPMLARLAGHFDLWLCDVQGHGDSDPGEHFAGWNRNAGWVLDAFEAHRALYGGVPVHAAGHSFGGVLTVLIAALPQQPFDRLVLLDPVLFPPAMLAMLKGMEALGLSRHNPLAKGAARRRARWPGREAAFEALHGRGAYKTWTDDALRAFVAHGLRDDAGEVSLKCAPWLEAEIFSSSPARLWPSVKAIAKPTLLLHGERSFPFVARAARHAGRVNRQIRAARAAGGHCFMQEDPARAGDLVRGFLLD